MNKKKIRNIYKRLVIKLTLFLLVKTLKFKRNNLDLILARDTLKKWLI